MVGQRAPTVRDFADWYLARRRGVPSEILHIGSEVPSAEHLTAFNDPCWTLTHVGQSTDDGPRPTGDGWSLPPFRPRSFDAVISAASFSGLDFPWVSMLDLARALRPDGLACLAVAPEHEAGAVSPEGWAQSLDQLVALAEWADLETLGVSSPRASSECSGQMIIARRPRRRLARELAARVRLAALRAMCVRQGRRRAEALQVRRGQRRKDARAPVDGSGFLTGVYEADQFPNAPRASVVPQEVGASGSRNPGAGADWRARRRRLASHLTGRGVELGAGHQPFECPPHVAVQYVDRWTADENRSLFPELAVAPFPDPNLVANFDADRLGILADKSEDFVICAHMLEHLAEPIGFVDEVYRVLRPGGVAVFMLPERRSTFDRSRPPTTLAHVVAEYEAKVTAVDDDHIREFLEAADPEWESLRVLPAGTDDATFFDWHRKRSIHVHAWDDEQFLPVLIYGIEQLGQRWELLDRLPASVAGDEFAFVLRRATRASRARSAVARFTKAWHAAEHSGGRWS